MFGLTLRFFVLKFTKYGRYLDLFSGILLLLLAWHWQSSVTLGFAIFSLAMFAINLNGIIQNYVTTKAVEFRAQRQAGRGVK